MSDRALENAQRRRDELAAAINNAQQQIDEWRRELDRTDAFIDDWHDFAGAKHAVVTGNATPSELGSLIKPPKTTGNSSKEEVADAARAVISERGEPIGRSELYKILTEERGLTIEGKDPEVVLSTMLWRMKDQIVRLKKGGYWLADKPYEPAQYDPDFEEILEATDSTDPELESS